MTARAALSLLILSGSAQTPVGESTGPESAARVTLSENIVDSPLQEIIDGDHAITVHLSIDEIDIHIAGVTSVM